MKHAEQIAYDKGFTAGYDQALQDMRNEMVAKYQKTGVATPETNIPRATVRELTAEKWWE